MPPVANAAINPSLLVGQLGFITAKFIVNGVAGGNTSRSSNAKSLPTPLVLLLYNSIFTKALVGTNEYTTFCQTADEPGKETCPEPATNVTVLALFQATPISGVVATSTDEVAMFFIQ